MLLLLPPPESAAAGALAVWLALEREAPSHATWLAREPVLLAQADPGPPPAKGATPTPPDGVRIVGPGSSTAPSRSDSARHRPWHEQPRFVMARSLLIPGWGQAHNRKWVKAGLVAGMETWLAVLIVQDQKELDRLFAEIEDARVDSDGQRETELVNQYNALLDQRTNRQWLLGFTIAYALADAYVDAHFRNFDIDFQNDPALPEGRSPESSGRSGSLPKAVPLGLRLALRWDF